MVIPKPPASRWQALVDITLGSALARQAIPVERRDAAARHALLRRIHAEFEEMRGLSVTPGQAAKLFGLSPDVAGRVLVQLTDARLLRRKRDGQFALRGEET